MRFPYQRSYSQHWKTTPDSSSSAARREQWKRNRRHCHPFGRADSSSTKLHWCAWWCGVPQEPSPLPSCISPRQLWLDLTSAALLYEHIRSLEKGFENRFEWFFKIQSSSTLGFLASRSLSLYVLKVRVFPLRQMTVPFC